MRISELQNKLAEIQGEYGNCHVIIEDETQGEDAVISNFEVEEGFVEDSSGDGHEVVSLRIPAEKADEEESQKEEFYDGMNYVQRLVREIEESEIDVPKVLFRLNEAAEKAKKAPSERNESGNDVLNNRVREIVQKEVRDAFYHVEAKLETIAKRAVDEAMTEY